MTGIHHDERGGGAVSAPIAIAVLALVLAIGLVVDGVRGLHALVRADAIAEEAARAAGQGLDAAALMRGTVVLDVAAARSAAMAYLAETGALGTVTFPSAGIVRVDVTMREPTVVLGLVGRDEIVVGGTGQATLVTDSQGVRP